MVSNMLRKYISVLVFFTTYLFAMVQSQEFPFNPLYPTLAQSSLYSASASAASSGAPIGSQSIATSSGTSVGLPSTATTNVQNPSQLRNPNIELFAHSLLQLLLTNNNFGDYGTFSLSEPYEAVFDTAYPITQRAGIIDPSLADLTAQSSEDVGVLTSHLFYSTVSHVLPNFLALKAVLTQDITLNVPQKVLGFVENYANVYGVDGAESVLKAVANGLYDYLDSIGLISVENMTLFFQLYAELIKVLASGAQI